MAQHIALMMVIAPLLLLGCPVLLLLQAADPALDRPGPAQQGPAGHDQPGPDLAAVCRGPDGHAILAVLRLRAPASPGAGIRRVPAVPGRGAAVLLPAARCQWLPAAGRPRRQGD